MTEGGFEIHSSKGTRGLFQMSKFMLFKGEREETNYDQETLYVHCSKRRGPIGLACDARKREGELMLSLFSDGDVTLKHQYRRCREELRGVPFILQQLSTRKVSTISSIIYTGVCLLLLLLSVRVYRKLVHRVGREKKKRKPLLWSF